MSTLATELSAAEWRAFANRPDTQEHMARYGHVDDSNGNPPVDDDTWLREYQGHPTCWAELVRYYESVNPQPPIVAEEKMIPESTFPNVSPDPVVIVEEPDVDSLRAEVASLKVAVQSAENATQYAIDSALRDVARKAARIASNAGFCGEYDRIAAGVGLPTRDELFKRRYRHEVEVTVTYSITVDSTDECGDDIDEDMILAEIDGLSARHHGNSLDWNIQDTESAGLYDPETGEEFDDD